MKAGVIRNHHLPGAQERTQAREDTASRAATTRTSGGDRCRQSSTAPSNRGRHQTVRWHRHRHPCGYHREALAGMTQTRVKARHTARTPALFARQAVVAAAFLDVNPITHRPLCRRFYELRARRFVALLVTPTLFLRLQPKPGRARENDIAVKDTTSPSKTRPFAAATRATSRPMWRAHVWRARDAAQTPQTRCLATVGCALNAPHVVPGCRSARAKPASDRWSSG